MRAALAPLFVCAAALVVPSVPRVAHADGALVTHELDALGDWIAAHKGAPCAERCFVLKTLKLGAVPDDAGLLSFELEGSVLADGPVAVPLFGPPDQVRLEDVTEDGKPAAVGFEGDHYFLHTAAKHFVLTGRLALPKELALTIIGPVNSFTSTLPPGRVVEGDRLSGLSQTTIHFDVGAAGATTAAPTVFQLSRAVRVARETQFEYLLHLRSGTDLGVVKLPLTAGERVLAVTGATGWRLEGTDLVLPTSGHDATITVQGTLPDLAKLATFTPDPRSTYEWWQLESDPEHRLTLGGDAKQLDSAASPFPRQPSSRLFLVEKGHRLEVRAETLSSVEALAAVVRSHRRVVVLTPRGDLVVDDLLAYENNGIDYLPFAPTGRPIFSATDGEAERILRPPGAGDVAPEMLISLRKGAHTVRVQSLSTTPVGLFGGKLVLDGPSCSLTESTAQTTLGLPRSIHPLLLLGGERPQWFVRIADVAALAVAAIVASLVLRPRRSKLAGAIALGGLYWLAPAVFPAVIAGILALTLGWAVIGSAIRGHRRIGATRWAVVAGGALGMMVAYAALARRSEHVPGGGSTADQLAQTNTQDDRSVDNLAGNEATKQQVASSKLGLPMENNDFGAFSNFKESNAYAQLGTLMGQGGLEGVAPVALPLPGYARAVHVSRDLVSKDRPFALRLFYVTDLALVPFGLLWLASLGVLLWSHRAQLRAARDRVRAWVTEVPVASSPSPAAPPAE